MATHTKPIKTVKQRAALKPSHQPYWTALGTGQHLGYRITEDGVGTWQARYYDSATRKRKFRALGDLASVPKAKQFDAAAKLAREFFNHAAHGGTSEELTIAQAWQRYADATRKDQRAGERVRGVDAAERAAADIEARLARHVANDAIANVSLDKLKAQHIEAWRDRLSVNKTAATVNRDLTPMRAALNYAKSKGYVTSDSAWAETLKPAKGAGGRRENFLDKDQRRALINAADTAFQPFLRMLAMMPIRVGAVAALKAGDYDAANGTLRVSTDKGHDPRTVAVPDTVAVLLRDCVRNKLPSAPLFHRPDGGHWTKTQWLKRVKAAAKAADLPAETCAYDLRHSAITTLAQTGHDLASIATASGTSVAMIEKHYAHLQKDHLRQALEVNAL